MDRVDRAIGKVKKVIRHPAAKQAVRVATWLYRVSKRIPGGPLPLPTGLPLP